ncbi:MAG TPA: acyl-CoA dehydrogenase family protein, partial [Sphingopyxis sp.]|uniref:acyl-CoA dehydrogenase family protein n=1 Tax=Sphingopyxis sp. TaxID=1908224 RepID=UPI002C504A6B
MATFDLPLREEQQLLCDSVQRFLADKGRPSWRDLADTLGLAGLALPEAVGGFGGGPTDIAIVMAALGPALAGADWLSHAASLADGCSSPGVAPRQGQCALCLIGGDTRYGPGTPCDDPEPSGT